jgi:hypothetical protein
MKQDLKPSWILLPLGLLACLVVAVYFSFVVYPPDRPVATIVPGSSSGPAFVVQIIRPRLGLPLGGIVPPQLFGVEAHLGFESTSEGASIGHVGPGRLELGADDWELALVLDTDGRVTPETEVVFGLMFEERLRRVRCRPGDPAIGTVSTTVLRESGELSGSFDIELARCEDADTGQPLGWPPEPLVLHGSFDRLPLDTDPSNAVRRMAEGSSTGEAGTAQQRHAAEGASRRR